MASSLLASTSLTLSSAVAAFLLNTDKLNDVSKLYLFGPTGIGLHPVYKLFLLIFFFLTAFFAFMQSIRAAGHASYAIGIPLEMNESFVDCKYVEHMLQRGASFYTMGTRAFYAAFIVLLWLFGPIPSLIGTIGMTSVCYLLDIHHHKKYQQQALISPI
jgi:uncharacterized membrane protein